ncbi:GIP [Symbiodinium sp. CCMP2592]|nr:GIP [Symbiodinium sp. CCMP2592]
MASTESGADVPTSYYNAPASEPMPADPVDQRADWSWDSSDWRWGDQWAIGKWYRPYDYYYHDHWSWGSRAEWNNSSFESSRGSQGEGDGDHGSGPRSDDYPAHEAAGNDGEAQSNRRGSWNSSGTGTGDASTRATSGGVSADQGAPANKGSFSEKMAVPSFDASSTGDELGVSARSYLRQVDAWVKVTRTPKGQQALLLYQHLSGRAWVESEELSVDALAGETGLKVLWDWIQERYQEVEVSKIAESLTAFFRRLKRQPGQTIREFNSAFDRSHSRLLEIDCRLPEVAKAWAYLSALSLSSSEELALLASVGNDYNTSKLHRAAVLHEKSLRQPWQPRKGFGSEGKGVYKATYLTGIGEVDEDDDEIPPDGDESMAEEEAILLHEAFVAQETAKSKYREVAKARGVDPRVMKDNRKASESSDKAIEDRLAQAKARSFCADQQAHVTSIAEEGSVGSVVQVAYEVGDLGGGKLLAITDTACSKTVTGQKWLEDYLRLAKASGIETQFLNAQDDFRFGASRLFKATYTASIVMEVNGKHFVVRASVVDGEVPLLLSRRALSKLGMIYDIENHTARFKHLGIDPFRLLTTDNGHPAIQVNPSAFAGQKLPSPQHWEDDEVQLLSMSAQYMTHSVCMTSEIAPPDQRETVTTKSNKFPREGPLRQLAPQIFYPKKIDATVRNMLCATPLNSDLFAAWWGRTPISKDFWIETASALIRVHVVPRRGFFDPTQWSTHQENVKQELLRAIGEVRSTSAVSCGSLHAMQQIHDAWRSDSNTSHPVLWIGRTIFSRASGSEPAASSPPSAKHSSTDNVIILDSHGECVAHDKGTAPLEGDGDEHYSTPQLEHRRAAAVDSGKEERDGGHVVCPQGTFFDEQIPTARTVPEGATNGLLALKIRDSCTKHKGDAIVAFGRHKGKLFKEVPQSYLERAVKEVRQRGPDGSSADLVSLSIYANQVLQKTNPITEDPEENALVPIPLESSSASSWSEVWSELTPAAKGMNRKVDTERAPSSKRTPDQGNHGETEAEKMIQDVPPGVKAEVEELMARLASLRDKYNI